LHVDDDEDFLIISKRLLEKQGLQVESVNSVKQALQKIGQKHYDTIVSDYKMFDKTGLELFAVIRNSGNDVPFFLVTGEEREEIFNKALNLGVDKCFSKDRNFEALYVELASAIKEAANTKHSTDIHKR
jgi:two-component system response regulator PilR (NtrC family)